MYCGSDMWILNACVCVCVCTIPVVTIQMFSAIFREYLVVLSPVGKCGLVCLSVCMLS